MSKKTLFIPLIFILLLSGCKKESPVQSVEEADEVLEESTVEQDEESVIEENGKPFVYDGDFF